MKRIIARIASGALVIGGWALVGVRTVLDLIGYSTVPEDSQVATGLLRDFFLWLLSVPWLGPWGFALISTLALIWFSWPRGRTHPEITNPAPVAPPLSKPKPIETQREEEVPISQLAQPVGADVQPEPNKRYSAYDKEQLSELIANFHGILDSQGESVCDAGSKICGGWRQKALSEGVSKAREQLDRYSRSVNDPLSAIHELLRKKEIYRDEFRFLMRRPEYDPLLRESIGALMDGLKRVPDNPTDANLSLLDPQSDALKSGVRALHEWVRGMKKQLVEKRKELMHA